MGTGPARKLHYLPRIFKGQQRRTGHRKRRGAFTRTASLSPGRADSRDTNSYKEKITLPRVLRRRLQFGCVTALGPEGPISVSGLGNINPIPFRSAAEQTRACVLRFGRRLASERISPIP
ncbi:hypothetical protein JTE90_008561 [Oedothorax gibbosus]|uniref:Uncharacterized protein n=1 Tax=Oedothorax gibbosus TaxID=931172 RepID=A0AAV6TKH7_9ARAC|nr:hypothetical protein JTE90_008561 [Oedothorax gibbosus]